VHRFGEFGNSPAELSRRRFIQAPSYLPPCYLPPWGGFFVAELTGRKAAFNPPS